MLKLFVGALLASLTAASWLGEEYWTTIGYSGDLKDGRTEADFLQIAYVEGRPVDGWVAYWKDCKGERITRSKYGPVHYEAFGHAIRRPDGRICGYFAGNDGEVAEVCGGFRVLSRNRHNPQEQPPLQWVAASESSEYETVGFHGHRIGRMEYGGEVIYGDAQLGKNRAVRAEFRGCLPGRAEDGVVAVDDQEEFSSRVFLLRKLTADVAPARTDRYDPYPGRPEQYYRDPHSVHAHGWNGHPAHSLIGPGAQPAIQPPRPQPRRQEQPVQPERVEDAPLPVAPVAPRVPSEIVTQDGTVFETRPLYSPGQIHPSDPRLRDPRSNPEDPRYDPRFDPRSQYYDGRYNPYDQQYNQEFDLRWRQEHQQGLHYGHRQQQPVHVDHDVRTDERRSDVDVEENRAPMRTGVFRSGDGHLVNAADVRAEQQAADTRQAVPVRVLRPGPVLGPGTASQTSESNARVLRPGTVVSGGVKVVDAQGNVYIKRIENGREYFYPDPSARLPPSSPLSRSHLMQLPPRQQGSHVVDERFQDPNYQNVRTLLRDRQSGQLIDPATGHPVAIGQGAAPAGADQHQHPIGGGAVPHRWEEQQRGQIGGGAVPQRVEGHEGAAIGGGAVPHGGDSEARIGGGAVPMVPHREPVQYTIGSGVEAERTEEETEEKEGAIGEGALPREPEQTIGEGASVDDEASIGKGAEPWTDENAIGTGVEPVKIDGDSPKIGGGAVPIDRGSDVVPEPADPEGAEIEVGREGAPQIGGGVQPHRLPVDDTDDEDRDYLEAQRPAPPQPVDAQDEDDLPDKDDDNF